MISRQNVILPQSNADLRQYDLAGRAEVPAITTDHTGPVATALGAVNLLEAVMAERRTRLLSTLAIVARISSQCDLTVTQEPETVR